MSSESQNFRLATVSPQGVRWLLKRNCSLTPRQLLLAYGVLCGLSLAVSGFFWAMGAVLVLPFAALELLALGVAFVFYARHAADRERIWLEPATLVVEWEDAGRLVRHELTRQRVRVQPVQPRNALVELRAGAQAVHVGRYLRADLREQLARELQLALQTG